MQDTSPDAAILSTNGCSEPISPHYGICAFALALILLELKLSSLTFALPFQIISTMQRILTARRMSMAMRTLGGTLSTPEA
jgi:hypothetical protein